MVLCVRWCLRFKLCFRNLVAMMVKRGLCLAHTAIVRWVQRYLGLGIREASEPLCSTGKSILAR
jgi:transposase-like protein